MTTFAFQSGVPLERIRCGISAPDFTSGRYPHLLVGLTPCPNETPHIRPQDRSGLVWDVGNDCVLKERANRPAHVPRAFPSADLRGCSGPGNSAH